MLQSLLRGGIRATVRKGSKAPGPMGVACPGARFLGGGVEETSLKSLLSNSDFDLNNDNDVRVPLHTASPQPNTRHSSFWRYLCVCVCMYLCVYGVFCCWLVLFIVDLF